MRKIVSTFALIVLGFGLVSCDQEKELEQEQVKGPQVVTLSAANGAYYSVVLSGKVSGLEQVALDYQTGFEYSTSDFFSKKSTVCVFASNEYSEIPFAVTLTDKAVDLGLSVKWADMNVDAYRPWERGNLYSWGETEPKESYNGNNYKFYHEGTMSLTKYCNDKIYGYQEFTDNLTVLEPADDVAHVKWGGNWRIPSKDEFLELMDTLNCEWVYTSMNGMTGYKIESKKNGNSIFMPDASDSHGCSGGLYWANSIQPDCAAAAPHLYFNHAMDRLYISTYVREFGLTIRPVQ